jgi:diguanylate cyclase (GGDEF)-like protein
MSMYRQLCLALVLSSVLALGGALIASVMNAQTYLEQQLSLKNMDNASALALSISQSKPSKISAEVATYALFDSGHYEQIQIINPLGEVMIERRSDNEKNTHKLLQKIIPIKASAGEAEISDGWKQFGTVRLISHASFAYDALFKTIVGLVSTMLVAGLMSGLLGYLVLRRIKKPLDEVVNQANAISNQRFITITEPKLPELKQLAKAMNKTVKRLKEVFENEAQKLEVLRKEANTDTLTGIANRSFFMSNLRATLNNEDVDSGILLIARIAHLTELNQNLGRQDCDAMLCSLAKTLDSFAVGHEHAMAARLNGSDFGLIIHNAAQADDLSKAVFNNLQAAVSPWVQNSNMLFVGSATFNNGLSISAVLAEADINLAQAEQSGGISARRSMTAGAEQNTPQSMTEWGEVLGDAIENNRAKLANFHVLDGHNALMHEECALRLQFKGSDVWQPAGKFISIAERLEMTQDLDLVALKMGIAQLDADQNIPGIAINLSASSIKDIDFCNTLLSLLKKHAKLAPRLWLEVNTEQAFLNFGKFKSFCLMMKDTKAMLGIEHFGHHFGKMGMLYDLGLDYIKVDAIFVADVDKNTGNQIFLHGLTDISHNIGIKVIAEGVTNDAERKMLFSLGFDGVTGPGIKL